MRKKGIMLSEAFGAVLTLVLIAILVIISIFLLSALQTTLRTPNTLTTAVNESVTNGATGVSATLSASTQLDGVCKTITKVYNGTGGVSIAVGNFTQTGCTVVNATNMAIYGSTLLFNYPYTYTAETDASNATGTMITQFASYPTLVGLVGTIIFLAIVIGVLVASFAFGKKGV